MAKKTNPIMAVEVEEIKEVAKEQKQTERVTFYKPFEGSLNDFKIKMNKYQIKINPILEVPSHVKEWLKKFGVSDA